MMTNSCITRLYSVTWRSDYRWGFGLDVGFTDHFVTHASWLHLIITPSLVSALYKSLQHTLSLSSLLSLVFFWQRILTMEILQLPSSTAPTKSSLHRLPYNYLELLKPSRLHLGTDRAENTVNFTSAVSVGTCLFVKALVSNCCVYLFIKNLVLSRGCSTLLPL
jgi:hypothetical protein